MSKQDDVKELIEKITQIDNEIKLLQEDRKTVLEDYKGKLDLKAFKAALRIVKVRENVDDQSELDNILDILETA
jgi:uncharacterized protein (UPF0335 family)